MSAPGWHSVHVHYQDEDDGLILDAVRPLFLRLSGRVEAAHHLRHWRRGPHLRLNVRAGAGVFDEVVRPAVDDVIGGYLRAHPSTRRLDPASHLDEHRRLAELEDERGPLEPWRPDNSIHVEPYDDRAHVLGNREMADLFAAFHTDTTDLSFRMTERCPAGVRRLAAAFDLVVATAHTLAPDGTARGFVSLRSHAEGFLSLDAHGETRRSAWEEHRRGHAPTLAERLRAVTGTLDGGPETMPFVREWAWALDRHRARAAELMAAGTFTMPSGTAGEEARLSAVSPFHRDLFASEAWSATRSSPAFALNRLLLNSTYLYLTRLGITPAERFLLCHLAAGIVEDRNGPSASAPLHER
ncbi:thiopeptide maturation pyridine synthase [Streptosporangium sp. NPDC023615]|uniref:thiopeptide maturation pyridine synthase n=1 Tax=Streptosporangium sp. NPDC023615 TaxID=3154794 RepID=UPI003421D98D